MLAVRVPKMFPLDAAGPAASGIDAVAATATNALVRFATNEADKLCDAHGGALSRAFGNFDRVVATGWLSHVGRVLGGASLIVDEVETRKRTVLVVTKLDSPLADATKILRNMDADFRTDHAVFGVINHEREVCDRPSI